MNNRPNASSQSIAIRTVRRILMQLLNHSYPAKQYVHTLFNNAIYIEPTYEKAMFVKDLFYLQDKGYLKVIENVMEKGSELMDRYIVLTAAGKEIAEQTMIDPAMEI
jgi:hypothetical protein